MMRPFFWMLMTLLYVMLDNIECFQFIYNDIPSNCNRNNIINCVESNKKKYPNLNSGDSTQSKNPPLDQCCFYVENLQCAYPTALKCDQEWAKKLSKTDYTRGLCAIYSNKEIRTRCPVDQEIMSLIGRTSWNNRRRRSSGKKYKSGKSRKTNRKQ
ncbi:uncharacterized protein LOC142644915 [Dermatophagoides pteronyssinus]|uniref:uncharacterized protein LOC142644915 n=1 Tax=Dermatophagoides pteronyssinus TaxID=6956 RepID=UPI003F68121D